MKTIEEYIIGGLFFHSEYGHLSFNGIVRRDWLDLGFIAIKRKYAEMYHEQPMHTIECGRSIIENVSIRTGKFIPKRKVNQWLKDGTLKPID